MEHLQPWFAPVGILLVAVLGGWAVTAVVVGRLRALFEKTETQLDDLLLEALGRHVPLWFALAGVAAAAQASPLKSDHQTLIHKVVVAGFFVSVTLGLSRFVSGAVRIYAGRLLASEAGAHMAENLSRVAVILMGAMLLLSNLGISITPVLTALGVGSLAVALALQDTLSNLFSGIHIVANRLVEVGDFIKLDSGQEGTVAEIGWRTTRINEPAGNSILVPNAKLSSAIIINYHQPQPDTAFVVQMGVAYGTDLERAERTAIEVAAQVQKTVAGGVPDWAPLVRYHTFADSSVNFAVVLRAKTFGDHALLKHEFIKRVHARFAKDGIEIPFPQRVIHSAKPS